MIKEEVCVGLCLSVVVNKRRKWSGINQAEAYTNAFCLYHDALVSCKVPGNGTGGEKTRTASKHDGDSRRGGAYKHGIDKCHEELANEAASMMTAIHHTALPHDGEESKE